MIDKRIVKFFKKHHVLTLATSSNNEPYCASCFYVYLEDENILVFTSDKNTKHISDTINQRLVAGAIALETKIVGKIRGVQFRGIISEPSGQIERKARIAYYKAFPYAALLKPIFWIVKLNFIKYTDNRLGFGKKIIWQE
jgi:uncharacterized protein YhbP (UPF0306 family)